MSLREPVQLGDPRIIKKRLPIVTLTLPSVRESRAKQTKMSRTIWTFPTFLPLDPCCCLPGHLTCNARRRSKCSFLRQSRPTTTSRPDSNWTGKFPCCLICPGNQNHVDNHTFQTTWEFYGHHHQPQLDGTHDPCNFAQLCIDDDGRNNPRAQKQNKRNQSFACNLQELRVDLSQMHETPCTFGSGLRRNDPSRESMLCTHTHFYYYYYSARTSISKSQLFFPR